MSAELEKLLTEDPYVVTVKPKMTKGPKKTKAMKVPVIWDNIPELRLGLQF
jgi:hypothetical protein